MTINKPNRITVFGIYKGKSIFHIVYTQLLRTISEKRLTANNQHLGISSDEGRAEKI